MFTRLKKRKGKQLKDEGINQPNKAKSPVWHDKLITKKPKTFEKGDNIVGWNINGRKKTSPIAERYYYIYTEDKWFELWQKFIKLFPLAKINISWEEQNWITIVQKN